MSIKIGSARRDENGRYVNGKAGDQDGIEVSTQSFYVHSKGWYILEAKEQKIADLLADAMIIACKNDNLGYDQNQRNGVIKYGIKSTVKTECDCSSLVRACCIYAGFDTGDFYTGNEVAALENTGKFKKHYAYTSSTRIKKGMILVTKTKGHTAIVIEDDEKPVVKSVVPNYIVGKTYTLQTELNVRKNPTLSAGLVGHYGLTSDGRKHDADKDGALDKGTRITCQSKVVDSVGNVWIKCPSGWVCAYEIKKDKVYIL